MACFRFWYINVLVVAFTLYIGSLWSRFRCRTSRRASNSCTFFPWRGYQGWFGLISLSLFFAILRYWFCLLSISSLVSFDFSSLIGCYILRLFSFCELIAGDVRSIMGEGMPRFGSPFERGNLHVKFEVEMPAPGSLSEDQIHLLRSILPGPLQKPMNLDGDVENVFLGSMLFPHCSILIDHTVLLFIVVLPWSLHPDSLAIEAVDGMGKTVDSFLSVFPPFPSSLYSLCTEIWFLWCISVRFPTLECFSFCIFGLR